MNTFRFCFLAIVCVGLTTFAFQGRVHAQQLKVDSDLTDAFDDLPAPANQGEPVLLTYKFEDGELLNWKLRVESELDVMGMVMPKLDQFVVASEYRKTDNGFQVTSQLKELLSEMRTRGGSLIIDTQNPEREIADPPFAPFLKIWSVVRENKLTCEFTASGVVDEIKVPDAVSKVVEKEGKAYGVTAIETMASLVIGIMQMPEEPVSPGDEWDVKVLVPPLNAEDHSQTATFLGTAEVAGRQMALIQVEFEASTEDGKGMVTDFESSNKALVLFEIEAGRFYRSYSVIQAESVINMGDREVMQSTSGKSTIERLDD